MYSERSDLAVLLDRWRGRAVLCVGDVMLDRFVYGAVERISPEAPIPVLRVARESLMPGGAGNVVRNLAALEVQAICVGVVGDDPAGREFAGLLSGESRILSHLVVDPARMTTVKTRFMAGAHQLLRADHETARPLSGPLEEAVIAAVRRGLDRCQVVVLSDYGKGVLTGHVLGEVIAMARAAGKPVVVDPKGGDYARYRGASVITPNRAELAQTTGMAVDGDGPIVAAARRLCEAAGVDAVLATRSEDGMTLVTADGGVDHIPAEAREVFDVAGAGDTVVAALAAALAAGTPLPAAARLANTAAGIVVGKAGTAVVHPEELLRALVDQSAAGAHAKVASLPEALDRVQNWRRAGLRVGFTNGCFDLLHPGHVSLLEQARAACDRLVVGLNSDASVARLKGPERPLQNELARATVLASLATVDLVVLFGEDTPRELIAAIRPDVLVKGADYTVEQVVGADIVQSYGGQVLLADLVEGHSTTRIANRIRAGG